MSYADFLQAKMARVDHLGQRVDRADIHPMLHAWQAEIVQWAVHTGRAAVWADTGLGKTVMQLEWARLSGDVSLIVAPLAVTQQTIREARKLGLDAAYVRSGAQIDGPGLWVTNYEMVQHVDPGCLDAVVLDEASILKQSDGKTRTMLIRHFADVKHRLACTATPAPNDPEELTNQAEFLGHMTRTHMLAAYFVHDDQGWRLKGHARQPMMQWMAGWALAIRKPSDMGYPDAGYQLPGLEIIPELLPVNLTPDDQLFATDLGGVGGRAAVRRETLTARCQRAVEIVNESHGWTANQTKLAAWDGSPSTRKQDVGSTLPTPPSGNAARVSPETRKPTASTCASTTERTRTSSSSTNGTIESDETLHAERDTPTIPSSGLSASGSPNSETLSRSATTDCERHSESQRRSTTNNSNSSRGAALSAAPSSSKGQDGGSQSTIVTTPGESEDFSVASATSASESSETTRSSSARPSSTYSDLEPWLIWCDLNDEQEFIAKAFGDRCFSVTGSQSPEEKADLMLRWCDGERPILVTKPKIAAFGMNFQHCARMAFVGLNDSYETYYQSIRRCYRYGQHRVVHAHIVLSELEAQIASNVARKEREASHITLSLVAEMRRARKQQETAA